MHDGASTTGNRDHYQIAIAFASVFVSKKIRSTVFLTRDGYTVCLALSAIARPSVRLSVTHGWMQFSPYSSSMPLVFAG